MTEPEHPLELELKYRADEAALRALALADTLGPARLGPPSMVDERDRYLDTPDLRLAAARWACRIRSREGRTVLSLKGPAQHQAADALHRRPEVEGPAGPGSNPDEWPPSPARDLLLGLVGGASTGQITLVERFSLAQRRTERAVLVGGRRIGLLSLDESTVLRDGAPRGELLVAEVEFRGGEAPDGALVEAIGAALLAVAGLRPDPDTKLEHALALLGEHEQAD